MDPHPLPATAGLWHDRLTMETAHARAIAQRLHLGDREDDGTPVIRHVQRVATTVPEEARAVAWLHQVLEWTAVTEQELLIEGLTSDELRALRLLDGRPAHTRTAATSLVWSWSRTRRATPGVWRAS